MNYLVIVGKTTKNNHKYYLIEQEQLADGK